MNSPKTKILGIHFFSGTTEEAIISTHSGGLVVAPSGPGLATLPKDCPYNISLKNADMILVDSGYLVLLSRIFLHKKLSRISGYEFIKALLADEHFRNSNTLWVDPSQKDNQINLKYLQEIGIATDKTHSYIAPMYDPTCIEDPKLLSLIKQSKPDYIILNIAGNIQEPLGYYLKRHLDYTPSIICTGAAIAFMTGQQAEIPDWADRLFLGWAARCIMNPSKFIPRYIAAISLALLVIKYGKNSVPCKSNYGKTSNDKI